MIHFWKNVSLISLAFYQNLSNPIGGQSIAKSRPGKGKAEAKIAGKLGFLGVPRCSRV